MDMNMGIDMDIDVDIDIDVDMKMDTGMDVRPIVIDTEFGYALWALAQKQY